MLISTNADTYNNTDFEDLTTPNTNSGNLTYGQIALERFRYSELTDKRGSGKSYRFKSSRYIGK